MMSSECNGRRRSKRLHSLLMANCDDDVESQLKRSYEGKKPKTFRSPKKPKPSSVETVNSDPWYTLFTKGDKEYTEYMKNEWGLEKVRNLLLIFSQAATRLPFD
ncbi:MAG: hypothetical protein GW890_12625 [Vibrio sp.]|nr:hypothetical protein [Vibrio sp.]